MKNAPVLHRFEYLVFLVAEQLLRLVGHRTARASGVWLGELAWLTLRRRRRIAIDNLRLAFPDWDAAEHLRVARASFRHLGRVTCDTVSALRFDAVDMCEHLSLEGWEHFESARRSSRERGSGLLMMTAHLGAWETTAHPVGLYGETAHIIGRPLDNPLLDRRLEAVRTRFGNRQIPKRGAVRGALKVLRRGGVVGVLIDQRVQTHEGEFLPFFGRPAATSGLLGSLAVQTGAPIVPMFAQFAPEGRYRAVLHPPLEAEGNGKDVARGLNLRCLELVEREIRAAPETWLWLHRRWMRPPDKKLADRDP